MLLALLSWSLAGFNSQNSLLIGWADAVFEFQVPVGTDGKPYLFPPCQCTSVGSTWALLSLDASPKHKCLPGISVVINWEKSDFYPPTISFVFFI